jgi:hypothetical protein
LMAPRRWALLSFAAGILYITQGQTIHLVGFAVYPTRFLEVAGAYRVWRRGEFRFNSLTPLDKSFLLLAVYTFTVYGLRTLDGFFYQLGFGLDAILCLITFTGLLHDFDDFDWFLKGLAVLLVPYVGLVWFDRMTGRNLFEFMGGLTTDYYSRGGKPRCMGSFRHPSLMGSFGATFIAVYLPLLYKPQYRRYAWVGLIACSGLVIASNSGGPVNTAGIVFASWALWKLRRRMRMVRWGILAILVSLSLVMKAPIYYLPAKVSSITGGGGYHRSYLIEHALQDIDKWFLAGVDLTETSDWFPYVLEATGGADMTNNFLSYGVRAGMGAVIIVVVMLVLAFKYLGTSLAEARALGSEHERMLWGLGALLTAHISNWFSISYWDQFSVVFYLHFAVICALTKIVLSQQERKTEIIDTEGEPVAA